MKYFPLILIFATNIVFANELMAQCTGALALNLAGSSTGGNVATTITAHPTSLIAIKIGDPFTVSVSATGANLTYQWRKENLIMNSATAASYTVNSAGINDAGNYTVIVHGDCGVDRTSNTAFVQIAPLPLVWLDFQAKLTTENKVRLDWITISEINVKHFMVERSSDGINFTTILNPIGANNALSQNMYSVTDKQPFSGVNYYRIVETDLDGKQNYSSVRSVNNEGAEIHFTIFPNPSSSKSILRISTNYSESFDFVLTDLSGKIVYQAFKLKGNLIELDKVLLASGFYLYECRTNKNSVTGKVFVTN